MPNHPISKPTRLWHPFSAMGSVDGSELTFVRGEDVWIWDDRGNRYLDATASLWYSNVGHGREEIATAVADQLSRLEAYSIFGDLATEPAEELASVLAERAPVEGGRVFLGSGGGDAIETATKIARGFWARQGQEDRSHLIGRRSGYHGTHGFGTALGGIPSNRSGMGPLPGGFSQVSHDSLSDLRMEIERIGADRVAAFVAEPVIGAGGVIHPAPGYLEGAADICREAGILFVADAVICGFGRLGTWFGVERWGIEPDLICFAKGVTSGYLPLGGVVASARVTAPFWEPGAEPFRHGATYAGHAACCAAALANIELLERDGLLERGRLMEHALEESLRPLAADPLVGEVRAGLGTMAAVALAPDLLAQRPGAVVEAAMVARRAGVLVRPLGDCLAVSPPLTATEKHFALIADAIGVALGGLAKSETEVVA